MLRRSTLAGCVAVLMTGTGLAQPAPPSAARPIPSFDATRVPDPALVLAVLDRTAAAQIARSRERKLPLASNAVQDITANWVSAAFLTGLTRLTRVSDASGGTAFLRDVAQHYNFGLQGGHSAHTMLDADNIAIGEAYEELRARSGWAHETDPLRQRIDYILPYLTLDPAPQRLVWWWCDALFMAPPVMARLAVQTGDMAYLYAMDTQWWRATERLWSAADGLYFRDERFPARRSKHGAKVFWSRGNGWVVGGIARLLESMPADYRSRPRYIATLKTMAARIASLQRTDGLWTASMLDPDDPPGPETSGSAFFVYALAWGINHGILDRATYLPAVLRGWSALAGAIQADGLLGYVQRTGDQPWPTAPDDHAFYGTGGLLLAGLEVMNLGRPATALPLPEPQRGAPTPAMTPMAPPRPDMTAAEQAAFARGRAERAAVADLAFEPDSDMPPPRLDGIVNPHLHAPILTPPADRSARASVRYAPYRYDDILWENDRTAHRIYGPALQGAEPPSTSGIDVWGKIVPWPFMERQLKTGHQHDFHGEGIDFYNVNTFRGAGGLGIWLDDKLWVSRNWASHRILKDGPDVADFEVEYAPWPVGTDRKVWEKRRFTLPLGSNFTRMVSTLSSDMPGQMLVGIGVQKHATAQAAGSWKADKATGRFTFWGPTDLDKGAIGVALMVDPAMIAEVKEDADNYLVILKVTPGRPFVYYMGATWSKSIDFHDEAAWTAYVRREQPSFALPG